MGEKRSSGRFTRKFELQSLRNAPKKHEFRSMIKKKEILKGFWVFFLKQRPSILVFLMISFLEVFAIGEAYLFLPVTLVLFFYGLIRISELRQYSFLESSLGQKDVYFWNSKEFREKKRSQLKQWDLVLVQKDQQVPCDLLILGTDPSHEGCFFDETSIRGKKFLKFKKPVEQLQKHFQGADLQNLNLFVPNLSGKVKVADPGADLDYFQGEFKVGSSPVAQKLGIKHFATQGSVLEVSEWVLGLAIYVGSETKVCLNAKLGEEKCSRVEKRLKYWSCASLGVWVVLVFTCTLVGSIHYEANLRTALSCIVVFSNLVPSSIYFIVDLSRFFIAKRLNGKNIKVMKSQVIDNLGNLQYLLVENDSLLGPEEYSVSNIYANGRTLKLEELTETSLEERLLVALVVCNKFAYDSNLREQRNWDPKEEVLSKTARSLGAFLEFLSEKEVKVHLPWKELEFLVLVKSEFDCVEQKVRVILQDKVTGLATLFVKSPIENMVSSSVNPEIVQNPNLIYFGSKVLSQETLVQTQSLFRNAKSFLRRKTSIYQTLESDLEHLGSVQLNYKLQNHTSKTFELFENYGLKFWLFHKQNKLNREFLDELSVPVEKYSSLVDCQSACELQLAMKEVTSGATENKRQLNFSTDFLLNETTVNARKVLPLSTQKYGVEVPKSVLSLVFQKKVCEGEFSRFLFKATLVNFLDLGTDQLRMLARFFGVSNKNKPNTLTFGKSAVWNSLMHSSDVSVQVADSSIVCFSDIQVSKFSDLKKLILECGPFVSSKMEKFICLDAYKNCLITTCGFLYQFNTGFEAENFTDGWSFIVIGHLLLVVLLTAEAGYFTEDIGFSLSFSRFALWFFLGLVQSLVICYFGFLAVGNEEGVYRPEVTVMLIGLSIQATVLIFLRKWTKQSLGAHSLCFILLVLSQISYFGELKPNSWCLGIFCLIVNCLIALSFKFFLPWKLHYKSTLESIRTYSSRIASFLYPESPEQTQESIYSFSPLTLKFKCKETEDSYRSRISKTVLKKYRAMFVSTATLAGICTVCYYFFTDISFEMIIGLCILTLFYCCFSVFSFTRRFAFNPTPAVSVFSLSNQIYLVTLILSEDPIVFQTSIVLPVYFFAFDHDWMIMILLNSSRFIISFVFDLMYFRNTYSGSDDYEEFFFFETRIFCLNLTCAVILYLTEEQKRLDFCLLQHTEENMKKVNEVLKYIFPAFVRKRVKQGITYIAEDQEDVTILFCNICCFDEFMEYYSPQELTKLIDLIFTKFDNLCPKVGMTKVETVGCTYMVCAGLIDNECDLDKRLQRISTVRRALEMAVGIVSECEEIEVLEGRKLQVKIGIHSGAVAAGVVGSHKPQFSLVGDTVNTASRMASTAENCIQMSEQAYELLDEKLGFYFDQKRVWVKGKGNMVTYDVKFRGASTKIGFRKSLDLPSQEFENISSSDLCNQNVFWTLFSIPLLDEGMDGVCLNSIYRPERLDLGVCSFKENGELEKFKEEITSKKSYFVKQAIVIYSSCNLVFIGYLFVTYLTSQETMRLHCMLIELSRFLFCVFILVVKQKSSPEKCFSWTLQCIYLLFLTLDTLQMEVSNVFSEEVYQLNIFYDFMLISLLNVLFFKYVLPVTCFLFFLHFCHAYYLNPSNEMISGFVLLFGFLIFIFIILYFNEKLMRINGLRNYYARKDQELTENLLKNVMPEHVLEDLKQEKTRTDKFDNMTLLYADIVGFTQWSSDKEPTQVVQMLSQLFEQFDKNCKELGIYKVHTIGDCYVVMGANSDLSRDPAQEALKIVEFAQKMISVIHEANRVNRTSLNMRIGIHTGEVIGGVNGTSIVRYDIYGSDVLIANKAESNGEPGRVCVSESTKELIENCASFDFEFHKEIELPKINQKIKCFLLT